MEETFTHIHDNNLFGSSESVSGTGSTDHQTRKIKEFIIYIVKKYKIHTFFDVPCGDFHWMRHIVKDIPNYIGGDIVKSLVEKNIEIYKQHFIVFDITIDSFPTGITIIFARDLFVHFPLVHILE